MNEGASTREPNARGKALVVRKEAGPVLDGKTRRNLSIVSPPAIPVTLSAPKKAARAGLWIGLVVVVAAVGYGVGDSSIRQSVDYHATLLLTRGVSDSAKQLSDAPAQELSRSASYLFIKGEKGPRADRFADAIAAAGLDGIVRQTKSFSRVPVPSYDEVRSEPSVVAGASLFLTSLAASTVSQSAPLQTKTEGAPPAAKTEEAPRPSPLPAWKGLLLNASVTPEEPKTLFGGLTEDEFRSRELRCMAAAIYFEARDEPVKGQIAVAQVIMNRIRSPYYPKTICGVVYEGERLRRGCQFSFTCTGKKNKIHEMTEWATAVKLAKQVISGEVWLSEVGYATHYHATYVKPPWRHELDRIVQIGAHIFYKVKSEKVQYALLREGL